MAAVTLDITGMTCEHCAQTVHRALQKLPGVEARVSYPEGKAYVEKVGSARVPEIVGAISAAGYGAREAGRGALRGSGGAGLHVAIIGSGSAAFAAAIRAAQEGARVTMIESGVLGGTCVNVGCVPSKILIRAAESARTQEHPHFAGLGACSPAIDRAALADQQQGRVDALRQAKYQDVLDGNPAIRLLKGHARFQDAHTLIVEGEGAARTVVADRFLIATGAMPHIPAVSGLTETPYWTSTDALVARSAPVHLIVLGSSVVALELAQAFLRLGSRVTVLARTGLLSREDQDVGAALERVLVAEGMVVRTQTAVQRVAFEGGAFFVDTNQGTITGDRLLVATGRRARTEDLGLEAVGVRRDDYGRIVVDDSLRTHVPHIYAAGDCTALPQFVYVAASAGTRAGVNMTGGDEHIDLAVMPAVVFTDPQVATVGLSQTEAERQGLVVESRTLALEHVPRALANFDTEGFVRLVALRETGRLVGAQVVAAQAGEVIQSAALAIQARMSTADLAAQLFPYLTMVEGLKLCAQTFTQDVAQLSCCAG